MPIFARAVLTAGAFATFLLPGLAGAQSIDDLQARLVKIKQELRQLQADDDGHYGGGAPAGSGGDPSIQRMNDMDQSVRQLTGQVEQLSHDVQTLKDRLDHLETETNFRLNQLEGTPNGGGPGGAPDGTPPSDGGGAPPPGDGTPPPSGGSPTSGPKAPGTIGDLPAGKGDSSSPDGLYNQAMDAMAQSNYDTAQRLFRQVISQYPQSDYAAQAQYWLADIAYSQKDYQHAAVGFADVLKKYPQSGRGPEAMLKLGMALIQINKKTEGCTALGAIKQKYPNASSAILSRADREAKKAGCS